MNIQWNIVTWYSKLFSIIFFVLVLPVWTFYLGMRYQEVNLGSTSLENQVVPYVPTSKTPQVDIKTATTAATTTAASTSKQVAAASTQVAATPKGIVLSSIYPENTDFAIKEFPDTTFTINSIVKATGPIQDESGCNSPASSTFLKKLYMGNSGICMNLSTIDNQPLALVAVDMYVSNDGPTVVSGNLIQLLYTIKVNGKDVTRLAQTYLPFDSYSISPSSGRVVRVGFMVPANQNNFSLVYGFTGLKPSDGESFFGASQGGYIVNFLTKSMALIKG